MVEAGKITDEQLNRALAEQAKKGGFLGQILIDLGFIDDNSLTSFLARHCRIPHLSLLDYLIDESLLGLIPKEMCLKHRVLPMDKLGKNLTVAMVNPLDAEALQAVREACPDLRIKPILCAYDHFEIVTARLFASKDSGPTELTASSFGLPHLTPKSGPAAKETPAPSPEAPSKEPEPTPEAPAERPEPAAKETPAPSPEAPSKEPEPTPEAPAERPEPAREETAETAPPSPKEAPIDGDSVISQVFAAEAQGAAQGAAQEAAEEPEPAAARPRQVASAPDGISDSAIAMRNVISVMRDSMCDTYAMLARKMDLFRGLSREDVARVFVKGVTKEFPTGQVIFRKGDRDGEIYVILNGEVNIRDGDQHLATLRKGDMFGEMAWATNQPRSADAVAVQTTSVLLLNDDVLHHVLDKEPALHILQNVVLTMSERLQAANKRLQGNV